MKEKRKYLPTLSELIDRLSIVQLKEVFIPDHKEEYAKEISDILREYLNGHWKGHHSEIFEVEWPCGG